MKQSQVECARCGTPVDLPCCFNCEADIGPDGACVKQCGWTVECEDGHLCESCYDKEEEELRRLVGY